MVTVKQPCFILLPVAKLSEKCSWQPLKLNFAPQKFPLVCVFTYAHYCCSLPETLWWTQFRLLIQNSNIHYIITLDNDRAIYRQHVAVIKTCFALPSPRKIFLKVLAVGIGVEFGVFCHLKKKKKIQTCKKVLHMCCFVPAASRQWGRAVSCWQLGLSRQQQHTCIVCHRGGGWKAPRKSYPGAANSQWQNGIRLKQKCAVHWMIKPGLEWMMS